MTLECLSNHQIRRAWVRILDNVMDGAGYQPFGWDWPTLRVVFPGAYNSLKSLQAEIRRRVAAGTWSE